ncbi:MAG: carboxypeptidase-like regulatory domain-containing protein [Gemmatimonadales bacterium]
MRTLRVSALVVGLAIPSFASAQDDSARVVGKVSSSLNGLPISGVMVAIAGSKVFHVTDSTGTFVLEGLPSGRGTLRIVFRDLVSEETEVVLHKGWTVTLAVLLDVAEVDLAPIVVEATHPHGLLNLVGFYARRDKGFGRFLTREDIERRNPPTLNTLLSGSGIQLVCRRGVCLPTRSGGTRLCLVPVYLDGRHVPDYDLSWTPPQDVAAVEIYRGGADTPVEFARLSGGNCGVVLIWTRIR